MSDLKHLEFSEKYLQICIAVELSDCGTTLEYFDDMVEKVKNKYALDTEEIIARGFVKYVADLLE